MIQKISNDFCMGTVVFVNVAKFYCKTMQRLGSLAFMVY